MLQKLSGGWPHRGIQIKHGFDDARESGAVTLWKRRDPAVSNKDAKFCVRLSFMKWWLKSAEFENEATKRPYVRLGVVRFLLHELRRHVIWGLEQI